MMTTTPPSSTTPPTPPASSDSHGPGPARPRWYLRALFGVLAVAFVAFWTWALFFASKEAVNKIGDREWAERAETICAAAIDEREALADFTRIDQGPAPELIARRADVVDAATDIVEAMLDDVVAVTPADAKGQAIVPDWEADYLQYIADRRTYTDDLRATGENLAFYESKAGTIPISDKVATFAGDNEMPSCSPPTDLAA